MRNIYRKIFVLLFTLWVGTSYSQTVDSLGIFPNPFASSTTIHVDIIESDTITLRVFNNLGLTIRTFFQSTVMQSGSYNFNLIGNSLGDGIYFVLLDIGQSKQIVKKAIKNSSVLIVEGNNVVDKFIVFPNPTKDRLTIPMDGNKTILVKDLLGKIVRSFTTDQQTISLSGIAAGQYLITILNPKNEFVSTQKVGIIE